MIAITRRVSPAIAHCELTHLERSPIDLATAERQHADYEALLDRLGCRVISLPSDPALPDSVFVEDTAVVLDQIAIITRPGAESRRAETEFIARTLERHRPLAHIEEPGTMDGGDILRVGTTIWIGETSRTNRAAIEQFRAIAGPFGYDIRCLDVFGCLHLKTAVTQVRGANPALLVNPAWIDPAAFNGIEIIEVAAGEPMAANALLVGEIAVSSTVFPRTVRRLEEHGIRVICIDATELAKAEGGLTCCSLILEP